LAPEDDQEALAAGKHVYIEKPMTHRWEDGEAFIAAVEKSGKVAQVGSQYMSMGGAQKAAQLIKSGQLGQVTLVEGKIHRQHRDRRVVLPDPARRLAGDRRLQGLPGSASPRDFDLRRFFQWRLFWDYSGGLPTISSCTSSPPPTSSWARRSRRPCSASPTSTTGRTTARCPTR